MGNHKYHFRDEEDARNWAERVDGEVHDNTHSPGEDWDSTIYDKSYTVTEKGWWDED